MTSSYEFNKLQLTQHLADSLLSDESTLGRDVFATIRGICVTAFRQSHNQSHVQFQSSVFSYQREAAPHPVFHAVYSTAAHNTCVVAYDTDVFILLLIVADKATKIFVFQARNQVFSSRHSKP